MGARFIGCDQEQVFLMPPSLRDWVPDGHLVWTVLDAVGEFESTASMSATTHSHDSVLTTSQTSP
jgi:hypothetical protein